MAAKALVDRASSGNEPRLDKARALDLWVEARWRNGKAWHAGTLEAAQWAAEVKAAASGAVSADVAESLFHQARVLDEWGRFGEAQALYEQAIDHYRQTIGAGEPRAALARVYLGGLLVELGRLRAARPYLEEGLEALESRLGPDHPQVAQSLVHLGWLEAYARNLEVAQGHFERALSILEARLGSNHPLVGKPLDGLTKVLRDLDDHDGARRAGRRAARIRNEALGPDHPSLIPGLVYLWWVKENEAAGRAALNQAKAVVESGYPPDHPLAGWALGYWALASDFGTIPEAWSAFERAVEIMEAGYGADHWRVGRHLGNLAFLMAEEVGDLERARELLDRAVAILETSEVQGVTAYAIHNRRQLYLEMGLIDLEEAIQAGEQALDIARKERARSFHVATVLERQARLLRRSGRLQQASTVVEEALTLREALVGPDDIQLSDTLRYFAEVQADLGDLDSALSLLRRALRICEVYKGPGPDLETVRSQYLEAQVLWATGRSREAAQVARLLETSSRREVERALLGLPEQQSLSLRDLQPTGWDFLLSAAIVDPGSGIGREAADAVIRSRGIVLDTLAQRAALTRVLRDAETSRLDRAVVDAREKLAHLVVGAGTEDHGDDLQARIREASLEKERAERALAARSLRFRRQHENQSTGLPATWAALPERSGLVSYVRFDLYEPVDRESPQWPLGQTPSYLAFVLRADRDEPQFFYLGSAATIEQQVAGLRHPVWRLAKSGDRAPDLSLDAYRQGAEALRSILWDPVEPALEGLERVFIVPDGELVLLHWGALPTHEGRYLIERPLRLHYLSAERDLVEPWVREEKPTALLAMGDPAYSETGLFSALATEDNETLRMARMDLAAQGPVLRGQRSACASFSEMQFEELPHSATELRSVASSWSHSPSALSPLVLSRAAANEAAFKARAPGKSVVHLATHGFYLGDDCGPADQSTAALAIESPLLLSGLALAGANHREAAGSDEEDGILTAEEIATLDLQSVDWAVLSGCETGVGEARAGEGVFGLRRAFQIAGARTVIMSLWPVDDEATSDWMAALYRHRFVEGASTVDAVRNASLELLAARREAGLSTHPFYWGGFVAAGDWR